MWSSILPYKYKYILHALLFYRMQFPSCSWTRITQGSRCTSAIMGKLELLKHKAACLCVLWKRKEYSHQLPKTSLNRITVKNIQKISTLMVQYYYQLGTQIAKLIYYSSRLKKKEKTVQVMTTQFSGHLRYAKSPLKCENFFELLWRNACPSSVKLIWKSKTENVFRSWCACFP